MLPEKCSKLLFLSKATTNLRLKRLENRISIQKRIGETFPKLLQNVSKKAAQTWFVCTASQFALELYRAFQMFGFIAAIHRSLSLTSTAYPNSDFWKSVVYPKTFMNGVVQHC